VQKSFATGHKPWPEFSFLRAIRRGQRSQAEILTLLREIPTRSTLHIRAILLQSVIADVEKM
jgi:hypothetical protein